MDLFSSMRVSASGLEAQTKRMNTISTNLANAEVTETEDGGPFKRLDPVFVSTPDKESFGEILKDKMDQSVQGVVVEEIHEDERAPRLVYNPAHPHADEDGYVAYPNVNPVEEMSNMISAQRSYEANISALNAAKAMYKSALEIGK